MDPKNREVLHPIRDIAYLQKLMEKDYVLKGPRHDVSKDLLVLKRFLGRGHEFIPENWLENRGYEFVEPSNFTKNFKLAYIIKDGILEQYFKSNYSLYKKNNEIHLYLKYEE
jgi:hypothetical protein